MFFSWHRNVHCNTRPSRSHCQHEMSNVRPLWSKGLCECCVVLEYSYCPWFKNCFSSSFFLAPVTCWLLCKLYGLAGKCSKQKLTLKVHIKSRQKLDSHQAPSHTLRRLCKERCHEGVSNMKLTAQTYSLRKCLGLAPTAKRISLAMTLRYFS